MLLTDLSSQVLKMLLLPIYQGGFFLFDLIHASHSEQEFQQD